MPRAQTINLRFSQIALASWLVGLSLLPSGQAQSPSLDQLSNGNHQMCSQPVSQDWQQGAGVCFVFTKQGDRIDGYYGYPHSDTFVCLRGTSRGTQLTGQGYLVLWEGDRWEPLPNEPLTWDQEQRLQLAQSQLVRRSNKPSTEAWILFQKAALNVQSFYRYRSPQMTSPKQLCDWSFAGSQAQ